MIFDREPVLILFAVDAAMGLAAAFGFDLNGAQVAAVNVFAAAVLSVICRKRVTPVGRVYPDAGSAE